MTSLSRALEALEVESASGAIGGSPSQGTSVISDQEQGLHDVGQLSVASTPIVLNQLTNTFHRALGKPGEFVQFHGGQADGCSQL